MNARGKPDQKPDQRIVHPHSPDVLPIHWRGFLIREFHKFTVERGHPIDEASLGRYINRDDPVVLTTVTCRDIAAILGIPAIDVMKAAGLVRDDDWETPPDWEERQTKGA